MSVRKFIKNAMTLGRRAIFLLSVNPRLFMKKVIAKTRLILPAPRLPVYRAMGCARFEFNCRDDRAIEWMYRGAYELEVIDAMREALEPGDTFVDVGANIGYMSFIAASIVGTNGHVHAFEPVAEYFKRLGGFARLNPDFNIVINNTALGQTPGRAVISVSDYHNIGWNTMVPGLMADRMLRETRETVVERLDDYIEKRRLGRISLIKIDTEGYELPVLLGMERYFIRSKSYPRIVCEVSPQAYPRLGRTLGELSAYLRRFGYRAFDLIERRRQVDITRLTVNANVLLVPGWADQGRDDG